MTDKLREAATQALEAIEALEGLSNWEERVLGRICDKLRAALAEPQGEPYCYTYTENGEEYFAPPTAYVPDNAKPLYTVPQPRREPLTDDEIREAAPNWVDDLIDFQAGIRFAERAHGITSEANGEAK